MWRERCARAALLTRREARVCRQNGIPTRPGGDVGTAVTRWTLFCWMLYHGLPLCHSSADAQSGLGRQQGARIAQCASHLQHRERHPSAIWELQMSHC